MGFLLSSYFFYELDDVLVAPVPIGSFAVRDHFPHHDTVRPNVRGRREPPARREIEHSIRYSIRVRHGKKWNVPSDALSGCIMGMKQFSPIEISKLKFVCGDPNFLTDSILSVLKPWESLPRKGTINFCTF